MVKKMTKHHYPHPLPSAHSKASARRKGKRFFRIQPHRNFGILCGAARSRVPPWSQIDTTCKFGPDKQSAELDSKGDLVQVAEAEVQAVLDVLRKVITEQAPEAERMAWAKQEPEQNYSWQPVDYSN